MARAELVANFGIIFAALISVFDLQRNGRSGGAKPISALVLKHAGENFHLIGFLALCGETVLAGFSLIKEGLNSLSRNFQIGWATVDDSANRHPMAFAVGGDAEHMAESVVGHNYGLNWVVARVKPLVFAIL